jgi:membrane protein
MKGVKPIVFCKAVFCHFNEVGCNHRAAALAYTSLLALVPLMTVAFAILAAFPVFKQVSSDVQNFIFNNFVAATGNVVQSYLVSFVEKAGQLSIIGMLFLIITAIAMMFTMEHTFNAIWRVEKRRRWINALMLYWTILTLSPVLISVSFAISSYLSSFAFFASTVKLLGLRRLLIFVPFLLSVCAFTLIYTAVPNCIVPIKNSLLGAIVAAVLFELAKYIFTVYVTRYAGYELLYGALATVPIFLLWVYLCWFITLLGAVISFILTNYVENTT